MLTRIMFIGIQQRMKCTIRFLCNHNQFFRSSTSCKFHIRRGVYRTIYATIMQMLMMGVSHSPDIVYTVYVLARSQPRPVHLASHALLTRPPSANYKPKMKRIDGSRRTIITTILSSAYTLHSTLFRVWLSSICTSAVAQV